MATANGLVVGLLCFALMAAAATAATQFRVGGAKGWGVPDAAAEPYNAWAGRLRFQIGDQLLFVYPKDADSVLLVDQAAYNACNTTSYITKFEGGSTVFTFDRSGPFFFISGNQAGCTANQKLIVVVLAASHTPPGLSPTPPSSMPPTSAPPAPSPMSSPPSPPSMTPPSGAPMPSPMSPPSMAPPMPSPTSPPSMAPPMPSPMSPPSMAPPMSPPSGAPMPTPESAPSPAGSAPGAAPAGTPGSSPGSPGSPPSPGTPGGAPQPPADSTSPPPPGADGANSASGAAQVTAGLISTLAAGFGYALLAV